MINILVFFMCVFLIHFPCIDDIDITCIFFLYIVIFSYCIGCPVACFFHLIIFGEHFPIQWIVSYHKICDGYVVFH